MGTSWPNVRVHETDVATLGGAAQEVDGPVDHTAHRVDGPIDHTAHLAGNAIDERITRRAQIWSSDDETPESARRAQPAETRRQQHAHGRARSHLGIRHDVNYGRNGRIVRRPAP